MLTQIVFSSRRNPIKQKINQWINLGDPKGGGEDEIPNRIDSMLSTQNDEWTMRKKCIFCKECKNLRSLRIHQARIRCLEKKSQTQDLNLVKCRRSKVKFHPTEPSLSTCLSLNPLTEL